MIQQWSQNNARRSTAFSPASISGIAWWLDAADSTSVTLDGSSNVSAWADKSGNGRSVVQATVLSRPSYLTNQLNGLAGIKFNGSHTLGGPTIVTGDTPWTIFAVGRKDSNANNAAWFCLAADKSFGMSDSLSTSVPLYLNGNVAWRGYNGPALNLGESVRLTLTRSGTTTTAIRSGAADFVQSENISAGPYGASIVGGQSVSVRCISTVFEIVLYDRVLSTTERQSVEAYLFAKWGTP